MNPLITSIALVILGAVFITVLRMDYKCMMQSLDGWEEFNSGEIDET